jgi:hypothetical protein
MARYLLAAMLLFLVAGQAVAAAGRVDPGVPVLPFSKVRKGMKGYGLSVFEGTEPERFKVEVIGVIENRFPHQGIILARIGDHGLERSSTVAGMSGSPVYLDGKLAGAIAYAWAFALDPIAGITPIESMLKDLGRDARPATDLAWNARVRDIWGAYVHDGDLSAALKRLGLGPRSGAAEGLVPVAMPLSMPAMPADLASEFNEGLMGSGLVPVAAPAGGGRARGMSKGKPVLVNGGSMGVAFLLGDFNMTGVGTVTHVIGDRLIGFGHPFLQAGATDFPILSSPIITVLANRRISFKMAAVGPVVGQLTGDFQASVVGRTDTEPEMVPIEVTVKAVDLGINRSYKMRAAPMPTILPMVVASAVGSCLGDALPHTLPFTYRTKTSWHSKEGYGDEAESVRLGSGGSREVVHQAVGPIINALANPYRRLHVDRVTVEVEATGEARFADLVAIHVPDEVRAGEEAPVRVLMRPYGAEREVSHTIRVPIPRRFANRQLSLQVGPADRVVHLDAPSPVDLKTWIAAQRPAGKANELAVRFLEPEVTVDSDGVLFPAAPPSLRASVKRGARRPSPKEVLAQRVVRDELRWVLRGTATVSVAVGPPLK